MDIFKHAVNELAQQYKNGTVKEAEGDALWLWHSAFDQRPDIVLQQMVGDKKDDALSILHHANDNQHMKHLSKIGRQATQYISKLWQPMFAGEAVTANDIVHQRKRFDMEYGEYVELSCNWFEEGETPYMDVKWKANLFESANIFVQFIDPQTEKLLTQILLGTDLTGSIQMTDNELSFHPCRREWAVAVAVEYL